MAKKQKKKTVRKVVGSVDYRNTISQLPIQALQKVSSHVDQRGWLQYLYKRKRGIIERKYPHALKRADAIMDELANYIDAFYFRNNYKRITIKINHDRPRIVVLIHQIDGYGPIKEINQYGLGIIISLRDSSGPNIHMQLVNVKSAKFDGITGKPSRCFMDVQNIIYMDWDSVNPYARNIYLYTTDVRRDVSAQVARFIKTIRKWLFDNRGCITYSMVQLDATIGRANTVRHLASTAQGKYRVNDNLMMTGIIKNLEQWKKTKKQSKLKKK
jgi:hypothetical protein